MSREERDNVRGDQPDAVPVGRHRAVCFLVRTHVMIAAIRAMKTIVSTTNSVEASIRSEPGASTPPARAWTNARHMRTRINTTTTSASTRLTDADKGALNSARQSSSLNIRSPICKGRYELKADAADGCACDDGEQEGWRAQAGIPEGEAQEDLHSEAPANRYRPAHSRVPNAHRSCPRHARTYREEPEHQGGSERGGRHVERNDDKHRRRRPRQGCGPEVPSSARQVRHAAASIL